MTPISSSDPNAIALLQEKIDRAEALQARMTAANKVVNKYKRQVITCGCDIPQGAYDALQAQGFTEQRVRELFTKDFAGRLGFPSYELTNNNANIRRMKQRIEQIQGETKTREMAPTETIDTPAGVSIVENADLDRLQIFFPDKPSESVRTTLKSNGFHWSPTEGAWQRQLNENARWAAKRVLSAYPQGQKVVPNAAEDYPVGDKTDHNCDGFHTSETEADYGGAFDGTTVASDADGGL